MKILLKYKYLLSVIIFFLATELAGSIRLSFITVRQLSVLIMLIFLLRKVCYWHRYTAYVKGKSIFKVLCIYYLIVLCVSLLNYSILDGGMTLIFARFLPSIMIYLFLLLINTPHQLIALRQFVIAFCVILCLNNILSIFQGLNLPLAAFVSDIFPISELDTNDVYGNQMSVVRGFFSTSVINGYFLASFGLFCVVPFVIIPRKGMVLLSLLICVLTVIALFFTQQRAAFYVYILLSIVLFIKLSGSFKYGLIKLLIFCCVFCIPLIVFFISSDIDWGRLANISDTERTILLNSFLDYIGDRNNFWLGNKDKFIDLYGTTPHNSFIDSFLLGGVMGFIVFAVFYFKLLLMSVKQIFDKRVSLMTTSVSLSVIAILMVSLTHSSGFHTGLTLAIYLLGMFIISINK